MKNSQILVCFSRILFPFILMFGFYIIINGHLSPGGGFQGGAILATAILITTFIIPERINIIDGLVRLEKIFFILIIAVTLLSFLSKGSFFTNPIPIDSSLTLKRAFIILLNFLIGTKVALGLVAIFSSFIEEGKN